MTSQPNYFDEVVAARYDDGDPRFAPDFVELESEFLAGLVPLGGRALEFAIGTGRAALPLAARGVEVHGIDLSDAMVMRLREKAGGEDIPVVLGDFASASVDPVGEFDLVFLVYNTIGNVTTQDAQVATFLNAARHLRSGGCFVVECGMPGLLEAQSDHRWRVFHHEDDHHGIDEYDPVTQRLWSHHYTQRDDGAYERSSVPFRYAWPVEMDLMARIAQMRPRERWAWWDRSEFVASSPSHVSVWEKA